MFELGALCLLPSPPTASILEDRGKDFHAESSLCLLVCYTQDSPVYASVTEADRHCSGNPKVNQKDTDLAFTEPTAEERGKMGRHLFKQLIPEIIRYTCVECWKGKVYDRKL